MDIKVSLCGKASLRLGGLVRFKNPPAYYALVDLGIGNIGESGISELKSLTLSIKLTESQYEELLKLYPKERHHEPPNVKGSISGGLEITLNSED